jgi:hypothetical protein
MAMRVPSTDYTMDRPDPGVTEKEFDRRGNLQEGINGQDRIDTRYENTERTQVLAPRGDARGRPMPRDARFRQADNHGEWGADKFVEPFEMGMDGPDSNTSYRGAGLPTRYDLSYPTESAQAQGDAAGIAPTAEGIDGDG